MDYSYFCKYFFSFSHIPIAVFKDSTLLSSNGLDYKFVAQTTFTQCVNRENTYPILFTTNSGYYSIIKILQEDNIFLFAGPIFTNAVSEEMVLTYLKENILSIELKNVLKNQLSTFPSYTYSRFANAIAFIEYTLNGNCLDSVSAFHLIDNNYRKNIASTQVLDAYSNREEERTHGTYFFEQQISNLVKTGNPTLLRNLLLEASKNDNLYEGMVGNTPLRQSKNIFLSLVSQIGKSAAIPGGLDIEQTYQLIDAYSQECEQLTSVSEVTNLQFNMLIDFATRVSQSKIPTNLSPEIYSCIQYINNHINTNIAISDVANYIHRSRTFTIERFKKELGFNIGEYITHAKIQEAKSLLRYTDKTLSEISSYLYFSSQSYFQNVFKRITGMTPTEYRKQKTNELIVDEHK